MRLLVVFIIGVIITGFIHSNLHEQKLPMPTSPHEALPSMRALNILSMGYRSVVADYYWLRALSHFGDKGMHKWSYPNLEPFIYRITELDPYFDSAYFFAGTALTVKGMDIKVAVTFLERGQKYCPNDWRLPFLLGFNRYYFLGDYIGGAKALAAAAKFAAAPPITGPLAARLAAEGGAPEVGIALVDSLLEGITDEKLRQEYLERRQLLIFELQLRELNRIADLFSKRNGRRPQSINELIAPGLLRSIPKEVLGGKFFINSQGRVQSSNDDKRLRVHKQKEDL
ncbi:MAG: hypothetical protein JW841_18230 [Deltaproteobacteria bacterium]|nr:hypothetical protein [Deltaproteobacteria bacterium]